MFDKILIANRGEIACRVIKTCRRLGIRTVAVYSEADAGARHVALADEAWLLGPAPARESYLRADKIIEIAKASGAQAIHPGYGFLSENADFAERLEAAGLVFIGPPAASIRAMGSKSAAKTLMEKADVPLVPGYHGADQNLELLKREARRIGFPVLIKASAGGGGKGMKVVGHEGELESQLLSAQREAQASFGDAQVLVEKYLGRPRHIEIQVFADKHGEIVYLFERDCSVQRRHQKVMEEAPAPGMSPERRRAMGEAACSAARAIGYVGAGTVEFIADEDGTFYFMEMNTRLQVEHPVTEMITGQDLVEWQLRVAAGQPLPSRQDQLAIRGHAFEARVYAEDPERDFLPAIGRLVHLRPPAEGPHVRVDTGVREGDEVSMHYDPMIAKLIVWDEDRDRALARMRRALADYQVVGLTTNLRFLGRLAAHPAFIAGDVDTGFIARHADALLSPQGQAPDTVLALAALGELLKIRHASAERARRSHDPWSPWNAAAGWRLNGDSHHDLHLRDGERDVIVVAHFRRDHFLLDLPGGTVTARGTLSADGELAADLDGMQLRATLVRRGELATVITAEGSHAIVVHDPLHQALELEAEEGGLNAPMPGAIIAVMVKAGDPVEKGAPLMILEAMKMEHTITAPRTGTVERVNYAVGDQVQDGAELLAIAAEE